MNVRQLALIICLNVAQLPIALRLLLVALLGAHQTGSFTIAGLAGGAAAVGTAVTAPWWARALPRFGDGRVLGTSGALFLGAQLALAVSRGPVWFIGLAAVSGLCTPPVSSSVRAMLPRLTSPAGLTRAYAVNSVAVEVVYLGGPLWVTGWTAFAGPTAALVASTLTGVGGLAVGVALAPAGPRPPRRHGPSLLAEPAVWTLGGTYLAYWICMGAMWVLLPAFAERGGAAD